MNICFVWAGELILQTLTLSTRALYLMNLDISDQDKSQSRRQMLVELRNVEIFSFVLAWSVIVTKYVHYEPRLFVQ